MALYGSGNEDTVITEYLDSHLKEGITQKNLDFILDLIDEYCELRRPGLMKHWASPAFYKFQNSWSGLDILILYIFIYNIKERRKHENYLLFY